MIASTAATWAIIIVVIPLLAFWLIAVEVFAPRMQKTRNTQRPRMTGPVLGGMHIAEGGRSVAPNRDAPAILTDEEARQLRQRSTLRPGVPSQGLPSQRPAHRSGQPASPATSTRQPSQAPPFPGQRTASHDEQVKRGQGS
jgi:hypothetical protein